MQTSASSILVHLTFSTRDRTAWILPELEEALHGRLAGVLRDCRSEALMLGGDRDHIHALVALSPAWAVADVVGEMKTSSMAWVRAHYRDLDRFQWQNGYGAFSVGQSGVAPVKRFIGAQKTSHRRTSFQDEFRRLCQKYEIAIDDATVWD
ncbi:MAG: transposase [Blastocatellia bacterium]